MRFSAQPWAPQTVLKKNKKVKQFSVGSSRWLHIKNSPADTATQPKLESTAELFQKTSTTAGYLEIHRSMPCDQCSPTQNVPAFLLVYNNSPMKKGWGQRFGFQDIQNSYLKNTSSHTIMRKSRERIILVQLRQVKKFLIKVDKR